MVNRTDHGLSIYDRFAGDDRREDPKRSRKARELALSRRDARRNGRHALAMALLLGE